MNGKLAQLKLTVSSGFTGYVRRGWNVAGVPYHTFASLHQDMGGTVGQPTGEIVIEVRAHEAIFCALCRCAAATYQSP